MDITCIKDIATIIFYITSIALAVVGFNKWKAELRGKTKHDLAIKLLSSVYRVRDTIKSCQNPGMFSSEYKDREPDENEKPEEKKVFDSWYAYLKRFERVQESLSEFKVYAYEAEVVWGDKVKVLLDKVIDVSFELYKAINWHHRYKIRIEKGTKLTEAKLNDLQIYENIIYGDDPSQAIEGEEPNDPLLDDGGFKKNLDCAVEDCERFFKTQL